MSTRPSRILRTAAASAFAGVVLATLAVAPAHAAVVYDPNANNSAFPYHLNPANEIEGGNYTVTWDPTSRTDNGVSSGTPAEKWGPATIKISTGCPADYRMSSRTYIVTADGLATGTAVARTNQSAALWGLQGNAITLTGGRASDWTNASEKQNPSGINAYVITCDPANKEGGYPTTDQPIGNAKYFVQYFKLDRSAHHWEVTSKPTASKTATTTTLAASGTTTMSTTLTATVSPAAATGSVTFSQGGTAIGKADVSNGVATLGVSGLTPATAYSFTAAYSGDSTYEASTTSAATAVTTVTPAATDSTEVGVTVPQAGTDQPTGLKITVGSSAVTLTGGTRTSGAVWNATGSLGEVTVTDDRRNASAGAWTLNGSATKFTGSAGEFAASNLGWAPKVVSGTGTAGSSADDLSKEQKLASGAQPTADSNVVTKVDAGLTLKVPSTVATGEYKAKLTLTLI